MSESSAPTIAYFDASLRNDTGHQANACRQIRGELVRRGCSVDVFASRHVEPDLSRELSAIPHFRLLPYEQSAAFGRIDAAVQQAGFAQDIRRAWSARRYGLAYFNSVLAPQLFAIIKWLEAFPAKTLPATAIEFGAPSGASSGGWFGRFAPLYQKAGRRLRGLDRGRPLLFTFDEAASAEYSRLFGLPVAVMPAVHAVSGPVRRRRRRDDGSLTLGFLGQQRTEKGVNLLPEIIGEMRRSDPSLRFLIHDGDGSDRPISRRLRQLADADSAIEFVHQPADPALWRDLLDRVDLLVLPYDPARYQGSYSAIAVEAVGAGIPMVVPRGTTMQGMAASYQSRTVVFDSWTAPAVCIAICQAVAEFDVLASAAHDATSRWAARNGAAAFVDQLLKSFASSMPPAESASAGPEVSPLELNMLDALIAARELGKRVVHSVLGADRHAP